MIVGLAYTGKSTDNLVFADKQEQQTASLSTDEKPSVDQVEAANLTASLADKVDLPIASNVNNQAISINAKSQLAQTNDETITKPEIIASSASASKSFSTYKVQPGDTVPGVAAKFNISANTLRWANDIAGDALEPGRELLIPPVNGIVYTSQPGDTAKGIAKKFNVSVTRIMLYNDLTSGISDIPNGTQMIIPGATPAVVASAGGGVASTSGISANLVAGLSGGNRYDYGYCTWYVYNRRAALGMPIGGMWGNASSWASLARASGFSVNNRPSIGAVMQTANAAGGYGHVAVVEKINSNGSLVVSEMNYRGWNVKSTRTVPADSIGSYSYIH